MKVYEDERWCHNCNDDTPHKVVEYGHERDLSNDSKECLVCHWTWYGFDGKYHPPSKE